jgi:hypothetical protein
MTDMLSSLDDEETYNRNAFAAAQAYADMSINEQMGAEFPLIRREGVTLDQRYKDEGFGNYNIMKEGGNYTLTGDGGKIKRNWTNVDKKDVEKGVEQMMANKKWFRDTYDVAVKEIRAGGSGIQEGGVGFDDDGNEVTFEEAVEKRQREISREKLLANNASASKYTEDLVGDATYKDDDDDMTDLVEVENRIKTQKSPDVSWYKVGGKQVYADNSLSTDDVGNKYAQIKTPVYVYEYNGKTKVTDNPDIPDKVGVKWTKLNVGDWVNVRNMNGGAIEPQDAAKFTPIKEQQVVEGSEGGAVYVEANTGESKPFTISEATELYDGDGNRIDFPAEGVLDDVTISALIINQKYKKTPEGKIVFKNDSRYNDTKGKESKDGASYAKVDVGGQTRFLNLNDVLNVSKEVRKQVERLKSQGSNEGEKSSSVKSKYNKYKRK